DVGNVKTHVLCVGRRSRLSSAKESAEAAVTLSPQFFDVHARRSVRVTASRRCLHQTSLRSPRTMMTRANSLHVREAGRPINVSVTQGPTPTRASPHTPRLRLPRQATTAEFRIVDLIAQH